MESTTRKQYDFWNNRIRNKTVYEIPGIGRSFGEILTENGYSMAYHLLGEYLIHNMDKDLFEATLKAKIPKINKQQAGNITAALATWCELNL